jgi:hypothetical protein
MRTARARSGVDQRLHDRGILDLPRLGRADACGRSVDAERGDQYQVVADVKPVDLDEHPFLWQQIAMRKGVEPT